MLIGLMSHKVRPQPSVVDHGLPKKALPGCPAMAAAKKSKKPPDRRETAIEPATGDGGALPHLDERGMARMVDIGAKPRTHRIAVAEAFVRMKAETLELLQDGKLEKGDALAVARVAGIAGSKRTADLIPLAHPITLTHAAVDVSLEPERHGVRIESRVETVGSTGVEMEALVAAATAALALYDMAKHHDRGMVIERLELKMKSGGRSGTYLRKERKGETEILERVARTRAKKSEG